MAENDSSTHVSAVARKGRGVFDAGLLRCLMCCAWLFLPTFSCAAAPPAPAASPTIDVPAAVETVQSDAAPAGDRMLAVRSLIDDGSPEALAAIVGLLAPANSNGSQSLIIAELHRVSGPAPSGLRMVLFDLLAARNGEVADQLVLLLSRDREPQFIEYLTGLAGDIESPALRRRAAVRLLGAYHDKAVARTLVGLLDESTPADLRTAAMDALSRMAGEAEPIRDRQSWLDWWRDHRRASERDWYEMLLERHARQAARRTLEVERATARLTDTQRQLYRAAAEADRDALLASFLNDPIPTTRALAITLIAQLRDDGRRIGQPVAEALVARLDDPMPSIRMGAARLVRDFGDRAGADAVARRLAAGHETSAEVLRAFLMVLARLPRAEAVEPVMGMLDDAQLRAEAADVLARAAEAGLMPAEQADRLAERVRGLIPQDGAPLPQVIELLGRVGGPEDWTRIADWLVHDDDSVRAAAARAWGHSSQPLGLLVALAGDAVIQPIAIDAAARRGASGATLVKLAGLRPESAPEQAAWTRALVAMSSRAPVSAVLEAQGRLDGVEDLEDTRSDMLAAAIDRILVQTPNGDDNGDADATNGVTVTLAQSADPMIAADLLLTRAALLLASSPSRALADCDHIVKLQLPLTSEQSMRMVYTQVHSHLARNDYDKAFAVAEVALAERSPAPGSIGPDDALASLFTAAVDRLSTSSRAETGPMLVNRMLALFGEAANEALTTSLHDLLDQLAAPAEPVDDSAG